MCFRVSIIVAVAAGFLMTRPVQASVTPGSRPAVIAHYIDVAQVKQIEPDQLHPGSRLGIPSGSEEVPEGLSGETDIELSFGPLRDKPGAKYARISTDFAVVTSPALWSSFWEVGEQAPCPYSQAFWRFTGLSPPAEV